MSIHPIYSFLIGLTALSLAACSSDEMSLTVGGGVMNDDHKAYYTEDFSIKSETRLSRYVVTNNSGIALCGSYIDDFIGRIYANSVFKVSPNLTPTESNPYPIAKTAVFDSLAIVMYPNGYLYGDSTKKVELTLYRLTEDYEPIDTFISPIHDYGVEENILTNISTTPYDTLSPLAEIAFIPEYTDSIITKLPDALGESWFNSIVNLEDDFIISSGENDDAKFIENILNGFIIKTKDNNHAILGFDMPTTSSSSGEEETTPGISIRLYYHNVGPYEEKTLDFNIYQPSCHYNQITADFSTGRLAGIERGGAGIPSAQTDGVTFVQSGVGLMTHIEIPTLNELFVFGQDITILDLDLNFSVLPYSFEGRYALPTTLQAQKLKKNQMINNAGLLNLEGKAVSVYQTELETYEASYTVPITRYGMEEQKLTNIYSIDHNTLLISAPHKSSNVPNVNRMIIGNQSKRDCKMNVKMHYTKFE